MSISPKRSAIILHPDFSVSSYFTNSAKIRKQSRCSSPHGESSSQEIMPLITKEELNKALEEWLQAKESDMIGDAERKEKKLEPKKIVLEGMQKAVGRIKSVFEEKKAELSLVGCHLEELPPILESLTFLKKLNLNHNNLKELPSIFVDLKNLTHLECSHNKFEKFPHTVLEAPNVVEINMERNLIKSLPDKINEMDTLKRLYVAYNKLKNISPQMFIQLEALDIKYNKDIHHCPQIMPSAIRLKKLWVQGTSIKYNDTKYISDNTKIQNDFLELKKSEDASEKQIQEKKEFTDRLKEQIKNRAEQTSYRNIFPDALPSRPAACGLFCIPFNANNDYIKIASRELLLIYHPDKSPEEHKEERTNATINIKKIHDFLLNVNPYG